ncbi:MAG: hypothetical protein ACW986_20060, partial [Promethearchaeota archaeon]
MKSKTKSKILILILLGIVSTLLPMNPSNFNFIMSNNNKSSEYRDQINFDNANLKIAQTSERIHIEGNSGWVDFRNAGK